FDTFTRPDLFLHGFSAGAPADALAVQGQTWGFPPLHPRAGRADGYAHLRAVLRHMLSVAGVLRIDHVMGLYRMFCVPSGRPGTDGAYIRYPEHEMFAIVMIEAARAGAVVVGEDLGTVPPAVRQAMKESGILGMHVQQYALGGPPGNEIHPASPHVLASLNTHDAPTFASYWHADDVALRLRLKHTTKSPAAAETAGRAACNRTVASALRALKLPTGTAQATALSLMRLQARGPAPLTQVNLEDLWAERRPQNVPGTSTEYPNWRRRAAKKLPALLKDPKAAAALALLQRERNATTGKARP
ncbi:MAG: 4-alpha-glucanotransferase, partial [Phycisphaerales bacterium]|nr:4-alpha-glucanotransferase [Phycisphaerales bacterium]